MAAQGFSAWFTLSLVVIVLVVGGVGIGYFYHENHRPPAAGPRTVALGDNVTVNYIGSFALGPEKGRIFDTSILGIAKNNQSYPKSLEFSFRANVSQYLPLGVYVGPNPPSSGYSNHNTSFGGVVTGFWRGLIGLEGNRTATLTIPPSRGYGPLNTSCLVTAPLVYHLPVVRTLPASGFAQAYPNVTKSVGTEFADPTYGWEDLVLSANVTSVSVENLPAVGFVSSTTHWPVTVTNISAGEITLVNDLTSGNVGTVKGHATTSVCSQSTFIVSAVDAANGTYTENFNREVIGQTLVFTVTVVDIYP